MKRDVIHYSHSRKDVIDFIKIYKLSIDYEDLSKIELHKALYDHFKSISINGDLNELKQYLMMSIPTKMNLNIEKKEEVYVIIQRLLFYCRNNYRINKSVYGSMGEILKDAKFICQWGDLPSVRYVINNLNNDNKVKEVLVPRLSRTPRKNATQPSNGSTLKVERGEFLVKFQ